MVRLASHKIFFGKDSYLSNGVVGIDENGCFVELFSLGDCSVEPANTRFCDEDIFLMKKGESPEDGHQPFLPQKGEQVDIYFPKGF